MDKDHIQHEYDDKNSRTIAYMAKTNKSDFRHCEEVALLNTQTTPKTRPIDLLSTSPVRSPQKVGPRIRIVLYSSSTTTTPKHSFDRVDATQSHDDLPAVISTTLVAPFAML